MVYLRIEKYKLMESIVNKYIQKLSWVKTTFVRSVMNDINWDTRLIGIKGARGVGKTTLLLQYIKLNIENPGKNALYVSLDNLWFSEHKLTELVNFFTLRGGKYLFLDEIHKYPDWSIEIKNIYDDFPELKIVFTGSSLLEILNARADLSRRAIIYNMQGLSFREYIGLKSEIQLPRYSFKDIISNHEEISRDINQKIKPFEFFPEYLKEGYYPFFLEQANLYHSRVEGIINMILEIELPLLRKVQVGYIPKVKQLLFIIAGSAPFVPNILKLSEKMVINRETLMAYLHYLNETHLIFSVYKNAKGISLLQKPDKLYLENSNLIFTINNEFHNIGNIRETFFANQLRYQHTVEIDKHVDFVIDENYFFEIGGKNKNRKQIQETKNSFRVLDEIETGINDKIPLWLFGFLY